MDSKQVYEALRVSQLDAYELDGELQHVLFTEFNQIFKYIKPRWVQTLDIELRTVMDTILWMFTLHQKDATIGQQLLGLCYHSCGEEANRMQQHKGTVIQQLKPISNQQKKLVLACTVFCPWLVQRTPSLSQRMRIPQVNNWVHRAETVWKMAELINSVVFLVQGRYRALWERLIGIRAVYPQPQYARQIGAEFIERELLWHGFAEMLYFLLPLVNFHRIKNFCKRMVTRQQNTDSSVNIIRQSADYRHCVVCDQWPTLGYSIGCAHVFCYYCLMSNYRTDPSFICPSCSQPIASPESIVPVIVEAKAL